MNEEWFDLGSTQVKRDYLAARTADLARFIRCLPSARYIRAAGSAWPWRERRDVAETLREWRAIENEGAEAFAAELARRGYAPDAGY